MLTNQLFSLRIRSELTIATVAAAMLVFASMAGCGGDDGDTTPPSSTFRVSSCGGFGKTLQSAPGYSYCAAEVLDWSYDNSKQLLTLVDKRAVLNCCGDRTQQVRFDNGVLVVTQKDAPEGANGRCRCECTFDLETVVSVAPGQLQVRLERTVTDATNPKPRVLFDGVVDLQGAGQGVETIDTTSTSFCEEPTPQPGPTPLPTTPTISGCGGFDAASKADPAPSPVPSPSPQPNNYCDAEVLRWSYDAQKATLTVEDRRVTLNCCGERNITATLENGVYVIRELDAPEGGQQGGRCFCMCTFDFRLEIPQVVGNTVDIKLMRDTTDDNALEKTVWSGSLPISQGTGDVVVDTTPAAHCQ